MELLLIVIVLVFYLVVAAFTVTAAGANRNCASGSRIDFESDSMVLQSVYSPVLPEMDPFLFASVGEEVGGNPLSVLSALAQLNLDPRNEAVRLSNLTSDAAASELERLFALLPDRLWTSWEIQGIASKLVELLPAAENGGKADRITNANLGKLSPIASGRLIYLALALSAALALGLIANSFIASDHRETAAPVAPANSHGSN